MIKAAVIRKLRTTLMTITSQNLYRINGVSGHLFVQQLAAQSPCFLPDGLKGSLPTVEEIEAELMWKG